VTFLRRFVANPSTFGLVRFFFLGARSTAQLVAAVCFAEREREREREREGFGGF
jgi:hypothetical protein